VRRVTQQIVRTLLVHHIPESLSVHPGTSVVANFCIQKLESEDPSSRNIFYILSHLQEIIGVFPKSSIKLCCETIFRVMTLSNSMVTSSCLRTLQGLFSSVPKPESLPVDLNARIISALYDYQPNVKETQSLINWLQLMEVAFLNIFGLDKKLCISHLAKFYSVVVKCWQNDEEEVMVIIASTLKNLLHKCIDPDSEVFQEFLLEDPVNNPMHKMFYHVESAMSYQYHKAWAHVLNVLTSFFQVMGKHCYTVMLKCLQSLADMHDSYKFPYVTELEKAIGIAIQSMGPQIVLQAIPMHINRDMDKPDFPRSWLLPLLRDNIKKTELKFFIQYFLPLAGKIRNQALVLMQEGKVVEKKLYEVICSQVWSLLPGFCTEPTDLKECFKSVAQTLGVILKDEAPLRMTILSSLRLLISKNVENVEFITGSEAEETLLALQLVYRNNSLKKTSVYEWLSRFRAGQESLEDESHNGRPSTSRNKGMVEQCRHCLIDLCKAMLPKVTESQIEQLYDYCKPLMQHSNHTIKKKSYSVISELTICDSQSCKSFINSHLEDLRTLLCSSASGLTPSTRALRLKCLQHIIHQLPPDEKAYLTSIVSEAVLCTKENSVKARTAAFHLLIEIGHVLKKWMPGNPNGALREYMKLLLAGLAGSPHLMSASILAIGRIVYEFKDDLDSDIIHLLIENTCHLITSRAREVVTSALSFLKILFACVDIAELAQHVEFLVKSITSISEDNQRHFRFKAKEVFTRLIRKFGYEMISKMVPDTYQKLLTNIRKMEARKQRKKGFSDEHDDSEITTSTKKPDEFDGVLADSDEEMSENDEVKQIKVLKSNDPYIEEHGENDIVDFMDPAVNKRLLTMKPERKVKSKKTDSFPLSKDGRIIIQEEDDKSEKQDKANEYHSVLADLESFRKKKNKRKLEEDFEDDDEIISEMKAVKKGIHRSLGPQSKKRRPGEEFKAKKAGGDVKKGKFDPYAYIPLNRQALNKRKQVKLKGQFKNIVKAAKRGAVIGMKRKMRQAKKKKNH
ncbi:RRP12-like protein, partial [Stegodyphus dumicola]|uniref:RRP12-like protein n=1 Tax=Stegodyphus dumicola TaxID=202533 RepID=UPI0015B1C3AA